MPCPDPVAQFVAQILKVGLLQIRAAGEADDSETCAAIADHLHNLPDLLTSDGAERLVYYWDVEWPDFIDRAPPAISAPFDPHWQSLQAHIELAESRAS